MTDVTTSNQQQTTDIYQQFCDAVAITPVNQVTELSHFSDVSDLAQANQNERLTAALQVFVEFAAGDDSRANKVDKQLIDEYINKIDEALSLQIDEILHHPQFQKLESLWKGLQYLISNTDFRSNCKIELLNVSKEALSEDFDEASELIQSGLYKHIYEREYDTPGGEPYTAMISDFEFDASNDDVDLLHNISKVAASTHCPFIGNVGAQFFGKDNFNQVASIDDLGNYMDRSEYIRWNSFRETEDARYVGLTMPRFLLRLPYGSDNKVKGFNYHERVTHDHEAYLWGAASFPFAANMAHSFRQHGWTVNIRGPESGGKVENLPLHQYDLGHGLITKIPTEIIIPETRELELANLGFIPLSYYKNSDYACFFSANSAQKTQLYQDPLASANSRINARLPYIFLSARISHYLKVLQRETIGSNVTRSQLEKRLNDWLQTLVTKMADPDTEQSAKHPLRDGQVVVNAIEDNPGFYSVSLYAMPHFQIEGVDVNLSIVGKMPALENS